MACCCASGCHVQPLCHTFIVPLNCYSQPSCCNGMIFVSIFSFINILLSFLSKVSLFILGSGLLMGLLNNVVVYSVVQVTLVLTLSAKELSWFQAYPHGSFYEIYAFFYMPSALMIIQ